MFFLQVTVCDIRGFLEKVKVTRVIICHPVELAQLPYPAHRRHFGDLNLELLGCYQELYHRAMSLCLKVWPGGWLVLKLGAPSTKDGTLHLTA